MNFLDQKIPPLGMGCWPIGGAMFSGEQSLGYTNTDDAGSIRTIHAALDAGITLFDTAAAYGAGHAERLLAKALKDRADALIVTKIGIGIDESTKQLTGPETDPRTVLPALERCLSRLERDHVDLVLLHQNELPLSIAEAFFDQLEIAITAGKIRAYGWSTDFTENVTAVAQRPNFKAVQHGMNVLIDAPRLQSALQQNNLTTLIRSPLAMGLLTGKFPADHIMPTNDIRATSNPKTGYFLDRKPNPDFLNTLENIRELLTTDGRTLTQGALSWLWAKGTNNIPIPGARTVAQIQGLAAALPFGPLTDNVMAEIESLIDRPDLPERCI